MCHQNFYQPSEKITSLNVGNAGDIYLVSQLSCFDKFSCHKMHKLILMNVGEKIPSKTTWVPNAAI